MGLKSFKNDYNLVPANWEDDPEGLANRKANISSFGVLGAAFGALFCNALTDRLGRLRCWQMFITIWACGLMMQVFSSGIYGFILFARLFSGVGAGGLTVVAPLYLSEIAPAKSRGMVVSIYMVILLSTLTLGTYEYLSPNPPLIHPLMRRPTNIPSPISRLLHQLRSECTPRRHAPPIPTRASHPTDPMWTSIHRLVLPIGHPTVARI